MADQVNESFYIADKDLSAAAQVALELGRPLLLTGEPGTGKTTFAQHLARRLAPDFFARSDSGAPAQFPLHTFETKSTSVSTDLFYRFDSLRRFHAVHNPEMSTRTIDYITFEALGIAIIESLPQAAVADLVPIGAQHAGPGRSVVLIDEIDKAPRDFPNDILNEIDRMFFRIPELSHPGGNGVRTVTADGALRPIVILTSNSEKNLPAPFLRRCIFHHISFPDRAEMNRLTEIVTANLAKDASRMARSAIDFFYDVREQLQLELDKLPTTYELIQWIEVLHARQRFAPGVDVSQCSLGALPKGYLKPTLGAIAKTKNDLERVEALAHRQFGT